MSKSINFVDLFDWNLESDRQYLKLLEGTHFEEERLPARILVKIKPKKNANQTNKRTFRRTDDKGL